MAGKVQSVQRKKETVRIEIARDWSVPEFAELMANLQFLRDIALLSDFDDKSLSEMVISMLDDLYRRTPTPESDPSLAFSFDRVRSQIFRTQLEVTFEGTHDEYKLQVDRIRFESPGFVDVAGAGEIVKQIRIFLTDIYDRVAGRPDRKIAREIAEQELLAKKIANAEAMIRLGKHAGLNKRSSQLLVEEVMKVEGFFTHKIIEGKVVGVDR